MNSLQRVILCGCSVAAVAVFALTSDAAAGLSDANPGYTPKVPISAFARPSWFDRSRFHITSTLSVGSGNGFGGGSQALQVTSLSYQFGAPLSMSVNIGNSFGTAGPRTGSSFFLEGLDLAYKPFSNMLVQVHYRDVRSPLQSSPFGYGNDWNTWNP